MSTLVWIHLKKSFLFQSHAVSLCVIGFECFCFHSHYKQHFQMYPPGIASSKKICCYFSLHFISELGTTEEKNFEKCFIFFVIYNEIEWGQCFLDHTDLLTFIIWIKKQVKYSLNNLKRKLYRF